MDRATGLFVDGIGTAAATSGILSQLQGRIFALLYLHPHPLSLDEIAAELQQSKSNISINVRGLTDWHLVRRIHVPGSRRDHYEAAPDLVRVMQEIVERRFRWNMRQVLATIQETRSVDPAASSTDAAFMDQRLAALEGFFRLLDATAGMLAPGRPFPPQLVVGAATTAGDASMSAAKAAARRSK
jgi:DNA-binding transcriptional regulator GbsR (MarR family)